MRTAITGVRTIGVPVTDQDRAVDFYVGTLGFDKRLDAPVEQLGGRWIEVAPPGSTTTIALVPAGQGGPTGVETGIRLTTADAASLHQELAARGSRWASCCGGMASRRCSPSMTRTATASRSSNSEEGHPR